MSEETATLPLDRTGTAHMRVEAATLPLGGTGTGQMGVETATLPLGGTGTGQLGVETATLPLGGSGTGEMGVETAMVGLATFPPAWLGRAGVPDFGLAAAMVTEAATRATRAKLRKLTIDEFIG